ncbi:MAG: hypothetical protein HFG50_11185 [Lachnospiraceae bacterium]|jgi:hypothetical protein|nr:hypothetical protein [Lachnospiraceae bacterium]
MPMKQMEPTAVMVGGMKFYITPFPAFKAANISGELASVLAPLLGSLFSLVGSMKEAGKNVMDIDIDSIDADKAAEAVMNCPLISGDKLEALMRKLLLGGHIVVRVTNDEGESEAQRLDMDLANELFCGEIQEMFVLCFHVIKLNYKGFFRRFADLSGKLRSAAETGKAGGEKTEEDKEAEETNEATDTKKVSKLQKLRTIF